MKVTSVSLLTFFFGLAEVNPAFIGNNEGNARPGRIVNGRDAKPGEIKYQASLQYNGGFSFCGGTYIKKGWVLTAAHCARNQ